MKNGKMSPGRFAMRCRWSTAALFSRPRRRDGATMRALIFVTCAASAIAALFSRGCATEEPPPPIAHAPQPGFDTYLSPAGTFSLRYPSDWSNRSMNDHVLLLEKDAAQVTVETPYIPPHLPGMMTMRLVVNGYEDDLKQRLNDFAVVEHADEALGGGAAQRLVMTGCERAGARKGEHRKLAALIAIRNEQVYILEADGSVESYETAHGAMVTVAQSWSWSK